MTKTVTVKTRRGQFEITPASARQVAATRRRKRWTIPASWWDARVQERMSDWIKRQEKR